MSMFLGYTHPLAFGTSGLGYHHLKGDGINPKLKVKGYHDLEFVLVYSERREAQMNTGSFRLMCRGQGVRAKGCST